MALNDAILALKADERPMAPKIGFTRWYDTLPELSQAVRLLERANPEHRHIICEYIVDMQNDFGNPNPHVDYGLKNIGSQKVLGLMKSKAKRRWYDQDPQVHKAFNALYVMDEELRYEAAIRVLICLEALIQHEKQFIQSLQDEMQVQEQDNTKRKHEMAKRNIVKTIFYQSTPTLLKKIQFVRPEKTVPQSLPGFETEPKRPEIPKEPALNADHIIDDNSGMKLGGLQLPKTPNGLI